jgi:hypothetical protein
MPPLHGEIVARGGRVRKNGGMRDCCVKKLRREVTGAGKSD